MLNLIFLSLFILGLSCLLLFLGESLTKKTFFKKEFMAPFECGFYPQSSSMPTFSIRFFVLTLVFLIFDIELVLLFPFLVNLNKIYISSLLSLVILINLFTLGLFYEWNSTMLDWIY